LSEPVILKPAVLIIFLLILTVFDIDVELPKDIKLPVLYVVAPFPQSNKA
jgi:hypothetical protein